MSSTIKNKNKDQVREAVTARHTISVVSKLNLNALSRIVGLFSGRGFDIDSISFGRSQQPDKARITITTHGDEQIISQIIKQLDKIIEVISVEDLTYEPFVERELAIIKVDAPAGKRSEVMEVVEVFRGKIVDITPERLSIEITGKEDKIDAAIGMLKEFEIRQVARSGTIALKREFRSEIHDREQ